jgi:hypothetical protein
MKKIVHEQLTRRLLSAEDTSIPDAILFLRTFNQIAQEKDDTQPDAIKADVRKLYDEIHIVFISKLETELNQIGTSKNSNPIAKYEQLRNVLKLLRYYFQFVKQNGEFDQAREKLIGIQQKIIPFLGEGTSGRLLKRYETVDIPLEGADRLKNRLETPAHQNATSRWKTVAPAQFFVAQTPSDPLDEMASAFTQYQAVVALKIQLYKALVEVRDSQQQQAGEWTNLIKRGKNKHILEFCDSILPDVLKAKNLDELTRICYSIMDANAGFARSIGRSQVLDTAVQSAITAIERFHSDRPGKERVMFLVQKLQTALPADKSDTIKDEDALLNNFINTTLPDAMQRLNENTNPLKHTEDVADLLSFFKRVVMMTDERQEPEKIKHLIKTIRKNFLVDSALIQSPIIGKLAEALETDSWDKGIEPAQSALIWIAKAENFIVLKRDICQVIDQVRLSKSEKIDDISHLMFKSKNQKIEQVCLKMQQEIMSSQNIDDMMHVCSHYKTENDKEGHQSVDLAEALNVVEGMIAEFTRKQSEGDETHVSPHW